MLNSQSVQNKETDKLNDTVFIAIKTLCQRFLNEPDIISEIERIEIEYSLNFCLNKYNELVRIREGLTLKPYCRPFKEIGNGLDNLLGKTTDNPLYHLTKDITYTIESLLFCINIINLMLKNFDDLHENLNLI